MRRIVRIVLAVAGVVALIALVGAVYQAVAEDGQREQYPPPGSVIGVGNGATVHLRTWGEESDRPTLILDAGAMAFSSAYAWIGPMLGQSHHVVAYDRPGLGWSTAGDLEADAATTARALRTALEQEDVTPPYVMVGHSLGGFTARVFRDLYPDDVAGLALIDSTHPDQFGREGPGSMVMQLRVMAALSRVGALQLVNPATDMTASLPADEREQAAKVFVWPSSLDAAAAELDAWDTTARQVRSAAPLDDLPLTVVTAPDNELEGWDRRQEELADLSTDSRHVTIEGSTHESVATDREHASRVASEIERLLVRVGEDSETSADAG